MPLPKSAAVRLCTVACIASFRKISVRTGILLCALMTMSTLALSASASCQYVVNSQWNTGFTAVIRITNKSTDTINGWAVNWRYENGDRMTNSWNANIAGANPYVATNLSWNSAIQPGQSVEFGFQGSKDNADAETPKVMGDVCNGATSSLSSSSMAKSSVSNSSLAQSSHEQSSQVKSSQVKSSQEKSSVISSSRNSASITSSKISSSLTSSTKSSSSISSTAVSSVSASSVSNEFSGMSTHFDGLGVPYGGCGIPQDKLETQNFVALNVFNSPGIYSFWPRPISGNNLQYIGEYNNGKNCGRWLRVSIQEYCKGLNDGAQNQPFCRGGSGWVKDGLEGATLDMVVADSCGDDNAWCRDSRYHLDFSLHAMNMFLLNGQPVNLLPNNDNNRKISWHYIDAPNYIGDINIYFMQGAQIWWPAISINHLKNGIHGVEQLVNGTWVPASMNSDMGQSYILQGGTSHYQIRVRDANDELINSGRVYNFDLPASCNGSCSAGATQVSYSIQ